MATVYLAHDLKHDRQVAIKVLRPELAAALGAERFLREIRSPPACSIRTSCRCSTPAQAGRAALLRHAVRRGRDAARAARARGAAPVDDAVRLAREVAEALDYAHAQASSTATSSPRTSCSRRPRRWSPTSASRSPSAQAGGGRLTETGLSLGTPALHEPRAGDGRRELDGRTRQYALGCVLYEMLAGEPPYTGPTAQAIIAKRLAEPVPRLGTLRQVPSAVERVVTRALARTPADRFHTVREFAQALVKAQAALESPERPRARVFVTVGAAAAVLALITVGWGVGRHNPRASDAPLGLSSTRSVAVLPFHSLSADSSDGYFATGISEDVSSQLARLSGLRVVAHTSARAVRPVAPRSPARSGPP